MAAKQAVKVRGGRSAGDVLAGLCAVIALAALVVGIPLALLTFFGSPIPAQPPTMSDFTEKIGPSSLIQILVVLVWLAWLQLLFCVIVEVYAGIRGIGVPARVPLAGGTQSLIHRLVVSALLLFTATTAIMPAFTARDLHPMRTVAVQTDYIEPSPTALDEAAKRLAEDVAAHPEQKATTTKIYRVQPPEGRHHESLWEIADKCLGEGRRYHEIYELNKGHQQPDGSRLHKASLIRPGWVLEMPADAVGAQVVQVSELGDYFTHGHPVHGHEAAPQQAGQPHTGGEQVPGAKSGADHSGHEHSGQPGAQTPGGQAGQAPAAGQPQPQGQQAPTQPAVKGTNGHAPGGQLSGAPQAHGGGAVQQPVQRQETGADQSGYDFGWPQELAAASLLAAGLLVALGRRRRQQMWHRAFGHRIARPDGDAAEAEQALRIGADTEAVRLLDLGLRQMSTSMAADGRTLPTVYGVHLSEESLDLWIAPADRNPPRPWEAHDGGQVWRLHHEALEGLDEADLGEVLAPYPGLISIGTNDNGRILVDLEAAHGLIVLHGPDEMRRAVLAAVAVELATNRWSDHMRITLVGFGTELQHIAPDRIRTVASLSEALPELEARSAEVQQALAASGADSVLTGRCRGVFGEAWMPHYLIMADQPTGDEAHRLVALARTGQRMAAGYIVPGEVPGAAWSWEVNGEGRLQAGVLGFEVEAQVVPERHYAAIAALFRTAGTLDGGIPLSESQPGEEPFGAQAGKQEPAVDIRLLGPIQIDAPGPIEESRRALCTELLVYLATHPGGVHPTVLGGAVWPRGVTAGVRDTTIARVSDWLGRDSRGRPNLYYDDRGRIKLGSEVRIDWEVFRWLIWRSAAEPGSEMAYMSYALDLVRGPLLADRERGRYGWLASEDLEYEASARVIDVAHRLLLLRLDESDARGAIAAARAGLLLAPEDEGLWRDLLRATHAGGDQTRLPVVVEELRRRAQYDPMLDQLQPETEALIEELMPMYGQVVARGA
ncbi:MAG: hypothetical protein JWN52_4840 [Actinomycetia bacterium]|nr:hypothetical protein [Actinomycetes bacterium]